jgi:tetratricopeptide (TPR) repeat protein
MTGTSFMLFSWRRGARRHPPRAAAASPAAAYRDRSSRAAFAGAALFAVHPIHVEAVAGLVGRAEILGLLGTLGTVAAGRRALTAVRAAAAAAWTLLAVGAYLAGATSKESALVAPAILMWTEFVAPARRADSMRRRLALGAALAAAAMLLVWLRARAVASWNVAATFRDVDSADRVATAVRIFGENVGLLLAPLRQSAEYGQVPIATSAAEPGVLLGAALALGLAAAAFGWRRSRPAIAWGLATFLVILAPVSNVLFPIGVAKAERILYAPSAGFLVGLGAAFAALTASPRRPRAGWVVFGIVIAALLVTSWQRARVWRNNCALAAATIETAPTSPIFLTMHARCLLEAQRHAEARAVLLRVFTAEPNFPTAHLVLGDLEEREGNHEAALVHDEAVLAREPRHLVALSRSAVRLSRLGRAREAAVRYEEWRAADPMDPRPWAGLIKAYAQSGDVERASAIAEEAVRRFPHDVLVSQNATVLRDDLEARARPSGRAP